MGKDEACFRCLGGSQKENISGKEPYRNPEPSGCQHTVWELNFENLIVKLIMNIHGVSLKAGVRSKKNVNDTYPDSEGCLPLLYSLSHGPSDKAIYGGQGSNKLDRYQY